MFQSRRGTSTFDAVVAMEILSDKVISSVFQTTRIERIYTQSQYNHSLPSLIDVMNIFTSYILSTSIPSLHLYINHSSSSHILLNSNIIIDDYDVALRIIQSVLVNSYLKILSPSNSPSTSSNKGSSTYVIGICKYHLTCVVIPSIEKLQQYVNNQCKLSDQEYNNNNHNNNSNNIDSNQILLVVEICKKKQIEWIAHLNYLLSMIASNKPFMNIFTMPLGPPI